ncbi:hypothetical protein QTN25_005778 [Entamoeba marina]
MDNSLLNHDSEIDSNDQTNGHETIPQLNDDLLTSSEVYSEKEQLIQHDDNDDNQNEEDDSIDDDAKRYKTRNELQADKAMTRIIITIAPIIIIVVLFCLVTLAVTTYLLQR